MNENIPETKVAASSRYQERPWMCSLHHSGPNALELDQKSQIRLEEERKKKSS